MRCLYRRIANWKGQKTVSDYTENVMYLAVHLFHGQSLEYYNKIPQIKICVVQRAILNKNKNNLQKLNVHAQLHPHMASNTDVFFNCKAKAGRARVLDRRFIALTYGK